MEDIDDDDKYQKHGLDLTLQDLQIATSRFVDTTSEVLLDALGEVFFSPIKPNEPYQPKTALAGADTAEPTEQKLLLKKPAKIREEVMNRNKQVLEGAFHGTLHLYVDYAGEYKYLSETEYRLQDRLENLKELIEKKYPIGTWKMLGAGKYQILPVWDSKGRKQLEPQVLPPPPPPTKPTGTTDKDKEAALIADRMEKQRYDRMTKRAERIARDAKDPKKLKEMLDELTELRRQLKDLESDSTKMRANSIKDPEHSDPKHPQALPRGELIRIKRSLKELKEDKYPGSKTILETLLEAGADVNFANEDGFTALMFAARNGHTKTVEHLLTQRGIDVNKVNNANRNAMHYAALNAHKEIVDMLRKSREGQEGEIRKKRDAFGLTPKDCADTEGKEVEEAKRRIWNEMVYKNDQFKLVPELTKTDKPEPSLFGFAYGIFGIHNPDGISPPKEWKPGQWRISKVPDPACKVDPMPEDKFIKRWASASKKCGPPVKDKSAEAGKEGG